uniref:CBM35 domain-containing protein n=1 Tax=Actinomadura roseirufa TaxID=2094049 RepID=UPI0010412914
AGGCASPARRPKASGGRALGPLAHGCKVELDVVAPETGRYDVRIRYADRSGAAGEQELAVNGRPAATVRPRRTRGGDWTTAGARVDLVAGRNTLAFRQVTGKGQLDYVEVE